MDKKMPDRDGIDFDKTRLHTIAIAPQKVKSVQTSKKIGLSLFVSLTALSVSALIFFKTTQNPTFEKMAVQFEEEQQGTKLSIKRRPAQVSPQHVPTPTTPFQNDMTYPEQVSTTEEYPQEEPLAPHEMHEQAIENSRLAEEQADTERGIVEDRYPASDDQNQLQPQAPAVMEFKTDEAQFPEEQTTF